MADTGPRGPQGPAGTTFELPVAIANGGTGATTAWQAANALHVPSFGGGIPIQDGADLNDMKEIGNYNCASTSTARSLANCPCDTAFTMIVGFAAGNNYYISQELRRFDNGTTWYRAHNPDIQAWGAWYMFAGTAV